MTAVTSTPRGLLLCTAVLAVAGIVLLAWPHGKARSPAAVSVSPPATVTASSSPASAVPATSDGEPDVRTSGSSVPTGSAARSGPQPTPPLHGEGIVGDRAVQRSLEAAWPADLPAADQRELLAAGRALLRADATGVGRAKWPGIFPPSGQAVAPAFATARFRIQAAIARRHGSPDQAVVHLVWAGTDRGGTFTDLRIADWFFTRTITKGTATWTPHTPA
ncbi:hypothetical protein ABZX77_17500 [Streptomyces sp. NPDC004237]|uniref:hypothetical protein n=1 Tax=Streptomyces sp. NPDC004237 TaxID=3154455 RepID=UPI0033AAE26F